MKKHVKLGLGLIACILLCSSFLTSKTPRSNTSFSTVFSGNNISESFEFYGNNVISVVIGNGSNVPVRVFALCRAGNEEIEEVLLPFEKTAPKTFGNLMDPPHIWPFVLGANAEETSNRDIRVSFEATWEPY